MPGGPATDNIGQHVRQLREANERVVAATALLEVRVIAARQDGVSWLRIANALGVARQSATERFTKLPEIAAMEPR
jgi:hypothetical protein